MGWAMVGVAVSLFGDSGWGQALESSLAEPAGNALGATRQVSAPAHCVYYSMQFTNPPPMPVNPFPDLPVYEIGEGKFAYDDRGVDYSALREAVVNSGGVRTTFMADASTAGVVAPARSILLGVGVGGATGLQSMSLVVETAPERLDFVPGAGGTNLLVLSGLQVGSNYLVMAKRDLTPSLDKPWYVLGAFVASSTAQVATVYSPPSISSEFYTLWRGDYNGPRLGIESPAEGAIVSGDVTIKVRVTDISSVSLYAYVNGQPLAPVGDLLRVDVRSEVGAKHAGTPSLVIPAGALRNGQNHISIVGRNHGVEVVPNTNGLYYGNTINFSTTREVMIVASNEFAIVANPALSSPEAGPCEHQLECTGPGQVTLDILGLDGTPCRSMSASISDPNGGIVTLRWDFTNSNSSPYTNDA